MKKTLVKIGIVAIILSVIAEIPPTREVAIAAQDDVYIQDEFTELSDAELEAHTPTTAGTGWTEQDSQDGGSLFVESIDDVVDINGGGSSDGSYYTAQGTYTTANYKTCFDLATITSSDDTFTLITRFQDTNNYYALRFSDDRYVLRAKKGGVWSDLVAQVTGQDLFDAAGDQACLIAKGGATTTLIFIADGNEIVGHDDSASPITGAGEAGLGTGDTNMEYTNDDNATQRIDNFIVTEYDITCVTESAGAGADNDDVGTLTWSNPSNITVSDNSDATAITSGADAQTHYINATGFGFALDNVDSITGIKATVEKACSHSQSGIYDCQDYQVRLMKAGVVQADEDKADTVTLWATSDTEISYGGSTDMWSNTWTESDVENANFGLAFSADLNYFVGTNVTAYIDHVQIEVCYVESAAPPPSVEKPNRDFFSSFPF